MTKAVFCLSLLLGPAFFHPCATGLKSSQSEGPELDFSLDLRPFESPISTYLHLRGDGRTQLVRYNRSLLLIVAVLNGNLREADSSPLRSLALNPVFQATLRRGDFSGAGLSRGDQFLLSLRINGGASGKIHGFIEDAPVEVRRFVDAAQKLNRHLIEVPRANGFLRSMPIDKGRLDEIRLEGKLSLRSIQDLPADLKPIVNNVISAPGDFLELTRSQYDLLLKLATPGRELFVVGDDSGYQLTLYQSAK